MCGICGCLDKSGSSREHLVSTTQQMSATLAHRGPDDNGIWYDADAPIAFGHRRLSIIDLSKDGAQPMTSRCGRYTIVYNGEIYNFKELRSELRRSGVSFKSGSDTEVMLAAIVEWGLANALKRFNGMFAFALWDRAACELSLARDRIGEKPLYYGWAGKVFLFGSELKTLRAHSAFVPEVDPASLSLYLRHGYVPAPYTIYKGISKILPGTFLTISAGGREGEVPAATVYWSLNAVAADSESTSARRPDAEAITELDALLRDATRLRMISDVPLGAFLSGGIDSSTVVALMQGQSSQPIRTFSIGFREAAHDETAHASSIARHLGTDHTELFVSVEDALAIVPDLPLIYDEPFGDSSQIPTVLLARLTRRQVTVALSGDGGDELFTGYGRYERAERAWRARSLLPRRARRLAAGGMRLLARATSSRVQALSIGEGRSGGRDSKINRVASLLEVEHPAEQYGLMTTYWSEAELGRGVPAHPTAATNRAMWYRYRDPVKSFMHLDAVMYLPDDILVKVDRASMRFGLEARVPLIDHRLVEFAWSLPAEQRVRNGKRKWILQEVLRQYVPTALFDRPKHGFRLPVSAWLRGALREWAEELLDARGMRDDGYLPPGPIHRRWDEHQAGTRDHGDHLWIILMFQAWLRRAPGGEGQTTACG